MSDGVDLANEFVLIDADEVGSTSGLRSHDALEPEPNEFLDEIDLERIFKFVGWLIKKLLHGLKMIKTFVFC